MTTQPSSSSHSRSVVVFDGYTTPAPAPRPSVLSGLVHTLQRVPHWVGQRVQRVLTAVAGSSDPIVQHHVWKGGDRHGQSYYTIYDPITRQRTQCASETEVRAWLEQRYYH